MRAAQHFVSEGSGNKLPSPTKRVPKRPSLQQQQQQPHQSRTKNTTVTYPRLPPVTAATHQGGIGPEGTPRVVSAYGGRDNAAGPAGNVQRATAAIGAAATAAASTAAPATATALPATAHRSSLGSEWSSVTSGAIEVWRPAAAATGGASSASGPQPTSANGGGAPRRLPTTTCGEFSAAAPAMTMSFSPMISPASSPYALPPASDRRASTGAFITIGNPNKDGRFDSPTLRSDSPTPEVNLPTAGPSIAAVGGGGGGGGNLGSSNCWRDNIAGCVCVGYGGDGGAVTPNPAAAATGMSEATKPVDGASDMQIDDNEALWQCSGGHGSSFNTRSAAATSWELGTFAQPPRGAYVVRSAGAPSAAASPSPFGGVSTVSTVGSSHGGRGGATTSAVAPQRGGVVTLGFGGITDEELLACLGA
ncbi:hypothetical protein Vretifemale_11673 [Volvox reticuliferus]|uniref:Uncharacterized protein n=1 Tax=Volvox reticuliferus TaxID=1737510 RepID=A0A8J4FNZ1_9CHLO|nr:hypothetical protein Vretifemale_11673 [Volvox reticuliferus]